MDLTGGELRSIVRFRGYVLVVRYFTVGVGFWHEKWWRAPTYINMRFNYSLPIFNSFTMWTLAFRPQPSVDCLTITDIRDYRYRSYAIEWMSSLMSYWIARFRRNFRNSCYDQMAWLIVLFIKVYCAHRNEPPSGKAINPERFELNSLLNQVTSCHLSISRFIVYKPGWRCKNFSELSVQDAYGVEVKDKIPGTHAICSQVPMKTPYSLDGLFTPFLCHSREIAIPLFESRDLASFDVLPREYLFRGLPCPGTLYTVIPPRCGSCIAGTYIASSKSGSRRYSEEKNSVAHADWSRCYFNASNSLVRFIACIWILHTFPSSPTIAYTYNRAISSYPRHLRRLPGALS